MEVLDYIYLRIIDAFDGVTLSKPIVIKPIWKQKNPNVEFENYILLKPEATVSKNAGLGGERTKQRAIIRCDVRTNNVRDLKIMSRKILDTFKGNNYFEFTFDKDNAIGINLATEAESIIDYGENVTILTLVEEDPTINVGDTVKVIYPDGVERYMYVWKVDGVVLTLFGAEGIIYYTQVVGDENRSDKRRNLYRRLIDIEVRAYL